MQTWLEPTWREFHERLNQDRLAHALLLAGPAGIGKAAMASEMAALLLCLEPGEVACGACRSCQLLKGGAHPDRFLLSPEEGKQQILIDPIRAFSARLALTTTISPRKVAVFTPAEAMNINAANALLKVLEEPHGETVMILVSHDAARLPVTIRSRCQALLANPPVYDDALAWLQSTQQVDATVAAQALAASGGSPLIAADILTSGETDAFTRLQSNLGRLPGQPAAVSAVATRLGEIEPQRLWPWLSLTAASALRNQLGSKAESWCNSARFRDGKRLADLQKSADRNNYLAGTSVRQDLLLQEWLLEWATQPVSRD